MKISLFKKEKGGNLAQLARAIDLQSIGLGFNSQNFQIKDSQENHFFLFATLFIKKAKNFFYWICF